MTMVCVPDLMAAYQQRLDRARAGQGRAARDDRALRADGRPDGDPGPAARPERRSRSTTGASTRPATTRSTPRCTARGCKVFDPASGPEHPGRRRAVTWPASGPATTRRAACTRRPANEVVRGAVEVENQITKGEHDLLNPVGINCIRAFPGRGIRIWGARTLSSDPAWRYVNVRRLFNYVETSILGGHQLGGVRAERPRPVGPDAAHHQRLPLPGLARRCALRHHAGAGLLRQVRRRDQPVRGRSRRARSCARSASPR